MTRRPAVLALLAGLVAATASAVAPATAQEPLPPNGIYVDLCSDAAASTDLRRLVFGTPDESTYGIMVEGCEAAGAADWDVDIQLPDDTLRKVRHRFVGGASTFTLTDETGGVSVPLYTGTGQRRDDRTVQVIFPAALVAPQGDELLLRARTSDDSLPDAGRLAVPFPSPCAGGASVTTTALRVEPGRHGMVVAAARARGFEVGTVDPALGVVEIVPAGADDGIDAGLRDLPGVTSVEVSPPMRHTAVTPNDPLFPDQGPLRLIGAPTAWETRTASAIRVAVIDDGIDGSRADLRGRVVSGYDVIRRATIPTGADSDLGGHGTSVAAIIGARGDDGVGMAGVDWGAALVPVRVFDEAGCASSTDVAAGIRAATDLGAKVINLSLGGPTGSRVLDDAVAYATSRDVLVLAAAGNAGPSAEPMHPAVHPDVIAVGGTTTSDTIAPYSNQGAHIELSAPGGSSGAGILTLAERDAYGGRVGTSFAAPFVAGAAALYRAEHPTATRSQVRSALAAAVVDLGAPGRDPVFGFGRIDLALLLPASSGQTGADGPCVGAPPAGFTDVTGGVHAAAVDCLVHLDITTGITPDLYGPSRAVDRGQMATFLARLIRTSGGSLPTSTPDAFDDDDGTAHEANINALAAVGIVDGTGSRRYEPGTVVNRAQMASFLARAYEHVAGAPLPDGPDAFGDDDGLTHERNIDRVAAAGIATGTSTSTYEPGRAVRRDQMASFLVRLASALAS